jgi:hypothetical protein
MAIDLGSQDRWLDGCPSTVILNTDNVDLGSMDRWLDGRPSPLQYQQTTSGGTAVSGTGYSWSVGNGAVSQKAPVTGVSFNWSIGTGIITQKKSCYSYWI